ncbi:MAG: RnfABCDGE type electron transport complex subunit D [Candidatus Hydrogenedentes bacterium]|nr:RnfABCDGE type electron transport complex subunit D [Candidatus Hydrogenedentota bacterium]
MAEPQRIFELYSSPHLKRPVSTDIIMRNVVMALAPVVAFSTYQFGVSALLLVLTGMTASVAAEFVFTRMSRRDNTLGDWSAAVTGLLLALTLPPGFPLWMAAVGGVISVALGKAVFGGLGVNIFNPALVGRAFLQATFPVAITTWTPAFVPGRFIETVPSTLAAPFMQPAPVADYVARAVDGFTGATPLALLKFQHIDTDNLRLLFGMTSGSAGETAALLILLCGAYLAVRRMLDWRIVAAVLGSVFIFSGAFYLAGHGKYPDPFFMLFSGGLMLGAVFMATDMVTSPTTPRGIWIYGVLIGAVTVVIRLKGGLPEGVMYAILLGNGVAPLIDTLTQPRIYGAPRKRLFPQKTAKQTEATK